ncbi:aromatic amino acid lyase [Spirillospora sp. NPDC048911]|uniref:aromatic amino acid lyase n=1 Tax=Spirillospora sp. NPDC048911 TaxID=3364527 RepID=UPI0037101CB1
MTALPVRPHQILQPGRRTLHPDQLEQAAGPVEVVIDAATRGRMEACQQMLHASLRKGRAVYGATTGFGPLVGFPGREDTADQCENVLAHLTAGQGPDLDPAIVRAAMLARLWSLARGHSGVAPAVADHLAAALGTTFAPAVPRLGSLGASGDLIPLAYLVSSLRGHGQAYLEVERLPAARALEKAGLTALPLDGRDALALVNGTSVTAAAAGLAIAALDRSRVVALLLSALLADILGAAPAFLSSALLEAFGHPDAAAVGAELRGRLAGLRPCLARPLQESYSVRCTPQLLGAARSAISYAGMTVRDDLNGVSDNPLLFPDHDEIAHGGNFFGQPVAFAADLLSLAATQLGNLAERQLDLLVDPHRNGGLPPMLSADPGRQHALQGVQLAATAIVADMRRHATPASIQSLPTNLHNQDVIPFGTQAALNALNQARSLRLLHGSLAVALRQAVHVGERAPTAPSCARLLDTLADVVAPITHDRPLDRDVRAAADLLDRAADEHRQASAEPR